MMSHTTECQVEFIEKLYTKEELDTTCSNIYLKAISGCKCAKHNDEHPIELPNIQELHSRLCQDISDLLDWGSKRMHADKSGNCLAVRAFIIQHCLADKPDSLFTILENLENLYPVQQADFI